MPTVTTSKMLTFANLITLVGGTAVGLLLGNHEDKNSPEIDNSDVVLDEVETVVKPVNTHPMADSAAFFQELSDYLVFVRKRSHQLYKEHSYVHMFRLLMLGLEKCVSSIASYCGGSPKEAPTFSDRVDQTARYVDEDLRGWLKEAHDVCSNQLRANDARADAVYAYSVCLDALEGLKTVIAKLASTEGHVTEDEPIQKGGMKSDRLAIREALDSGKYDHIDNVVSYFEGPNGNIERVRVSVQGPVVKVARSVGGNPLRSGTHATFADAETRELTSEDAVTFIANHPWYFELH